MQENELYHPRIVAVRKSLLHHKLDAFVSSFLPTMRYLSGYSGSNGLLVVTNRSTFFFTDFRYEEIIQTEVVADSKCIGSGSLLKIAAEKKIFAGLKAVGFEKDRITVSDYDILKRFVDAKTLTATSGIVEALRSVKDETEIEMLKKAFAISDKAFEKILGMIKPGIRELELSAEISYLHKKYGAENDSFDVIVASGVRGSLPHGTASDKKIQQREFITLDFGCVTGGYHSDMTRTICVGSPTTEMKKVYQVVFDAHQRASEAVENGAVAKKIDSVARKHIASKGYGKYFGHSLGHGVGLEIHELPRVAPKSNDKLVTGNVITIEPGIYLPKKFGIRIEDTLVVREKGYEVLSGSPKELITI